MSKSNKKNESLYRQLNEDFQRYRNGRASILKIICLLFIAPGFSAGFLYRLSAKLTRKGFFGRALARFFWRLNVFFNACDIAPQARIQGGLYLPHPMGIVIGSSVIGENATILQNTTLGKREISAPVEESSFPTLRDNVLIAAGAVIIGPITIASNARIGANAVVLCNVPEGTTFVGNPAKQIKS